MEKTYAPHKPSEVVANDPQSEVATVPHVANPPTPVDEFTGTIITSERFERGVFQGRKIVVKP